MSGRSWRFKQGSESSYHSTALINRWFIAMFWFKDMNNRSHFVLSLLVILLWISSLGIMVKQNKEALTQVAKEGIKPKDVHVETSTPAVATPEVPSASPTATTESAPIKVKTIIFKCLIDTDVGEVFKQDAQSMTSERKAEMIKELETEVKSLMLKRHHLMNHEWCCHFRIFQRDNDCDVSHHLRWSWNGNDQDAFYRNSG